ncbi:acyltransferase family protein [Sphingomonas sp. ID0503]|uniref:acyltransferase family protein n=1 Tax=Sphingomonas sp. ID0503 TaxID=3399691 RepID=UPI003AFAB5FF
MRAEENGAAPAASSPSPMVRKFYRTDVQGLRPIGIALVVIFHIWIGKVSGGVDAFFVISAYFMTTSLLSTLEKTGRVNPLQFWGRIALRLLPVAMLVIVATIIAGAFLLPRPLWNGFALNGLASTLQVENLQLIRDSTDYLSRDQPASPFQQFWALSTQIQFFAFLPMVVWFVGLVSRRVSGRAYDRRIHLLVFGALFAASFGFALYILALNPGPHYFNPATRLWEFMVGSISAVLVSTVTLSSRTAAIAAWAGVLLLLSCGIVVPSTAPFPGLAALVPVIGVGLLIVSGARGEPAGAGKLLSHPFLQKASEIAFTVYLWHWPILVFAQEVFGTAQLNLPQGLLVIALAVVVAILTKRFVEDPSRYILETPFFARRPAWVRLALPFVFTAILAVPPLLMLAAWNRHFTGETQAYARTLDTLTPAKPLAVIDRRLPADIERQLVAIPSMRVKLYTNGCNQRPKQSRIVVCDFGDTRPGRPRVLLIGGSHSTQWFPAFEKIAIRNHLHLMTITKSACSLSGQYSGKDVVSSSIPACRRWADDAVKEVLRLKPDYVVTTATRPKAEGRAADDFVPGDFVPDDYTSRWDRFMAKGIPVIAIRDNPRPGISAPSCVARHLDDPAQCDLKRADHLSDPSPLLAYPTPPKLRFIDLSNYLCDGTTCPAIANGLLVYHDNSHISEAYTISLIPALERDLLQAMSSLRTRN